MLRFLFAGNDDFLRIYLPDQNEAAEYRGQISFQHNAA